MSTVYLLTFRGIDERLTGNMLDRLAYPLPTGWMRVEVPWTASYGRTSSYARSLEQGMALGEQTIREIKAAEPWAKIILAGYSGGAALAGNLANKLPSLIDGVVLVADPNYPGTGGDFGIAGARRVNAVPVRYVVNPGDIICCCPALSPLRILATLSPRMALGERSAWAADVRQKLADRKTRLEMAEQIGPWWLPATWARYDRAKVGVDGYLSGREHQAAYTRAAPGGSLMARARVWLLDLVG
ncbi:lysin B [Gordonia phage EMoore]|uniref:Lysin B n=1 Tax=Gordonia phage EMoore TaxID=2656534 RepID=A0A649VU54_9CAUD|nr:lysin B [Gordonia phage EMoore]QGJ95828.1 lysin B [Gordonia phage EMoore]